jgi:SAM-dependent methyltransferase/organic radical activating enzyme
MPHDEKKPVPPMNRHYDVPATPPFILLEVTNACNLRCRMCFIYGEGVTKKRAGGFMSEEVWRKAIEEIGAWDSPTTVDLHGGGEPFLHPQLFDIVSYAKSKKNISVGFLTNATLMDAAKARAVIETGVDWIGFSVDGSQKGVFEYYRKGAKLEVVEENIEELLRLRKNGKPSVYLNMVCHAEADPSLFVDRWKGKVDTLLLSEKRNNDKRKNKAVVLKRPCGLLYEQLIIGWDGKTVLCCEDYCADFITGSFPDKSLLEIWHGIPLSVARRMHEQGNCRQIALCGLCDSTVFHEWSEETSGTGNEVTVVKRELPAIKPAYTAEDGACPICSSHETALLLKRKDDLPVFRCNACGFMFTPRSVFESRYGDIDGLYEQSYFKSDTGDIGYVDYASLSTSNFLWRPAFLELVEGIRGKKILDIGCATGILLEMLQERGASEVAGVEISAFAAARAGSKGLRVFNSDITAADVGKDYDIITAFDVIEHVPDIHAFLSRVYELLSDDGVFVFLTPDAGSSEAACQMENWYGFKSSLEHIHYFSAESLRYALGRVFLPAPVLYRGRSADGQGILGFIRKNSSNRDGYLQRLFDCNFAPEQVEETSAMPVAKLLYGMGDERYKELISRFPQRLSAFFRDDVGRSQAPPELTRPSENKPDSIIVRWYQEGDVQGITSLFGEVFGREMTLDEWQWKYRGQGNARVCSAVIEIPGEGIVGHYGGIPLRMTRGGAVIKGITACDVMIRKKHRSFTRLKKMHTLFVDELIKDSFIMFYGFPNERTLLMPSEKLQLYERIEPVNNVLKDVSFNNDSDRYLYKLFPLSFDDNRIDSLWAEVGREFRLAIIRDRAYLKWRYGESRLYRYELWGLRRRWSQKLSALAVVRNEGEGKLFIMDLVFGKRAFLPLLSKVENLACALGVKQLSFWVPGRFHETLLKKGFALVPFGATLPRSTHPLTIQKDEMAGNFFYTMGDTDFL